MPLFPPAPRVHHRFASPELAAEPQSPATARAARGVASSRGSTPESTGGTEWLGMDDEDVFALGTSGLRLPRPASLHSDDMELSDGSIHAPSERPQSPSDASSSRYSSRESTPARPLSPLAAGLASPQVHREGSAPSAFAAANRPILPTVLSQLCADRLLEESTETVKGAGEASGQPAEASQAPHAAANARSRAESPAPSWWLEAPTPRAAARNAALTLGFGATALGCLWLGAHTNLWLTPSQAWLQGARDAVATFGHQAMQPSNLRNAAAGAWDGFWYGAPTFVYEHGRRLPCERVVDVVSHASLRTPSKSALLLSRQLELVRSYQHTH